MEATEEKLITPIEEINELMAELTALRNESGGATERINFDPDGIEKGMAKLVLTILELLYQLMERQALHRMEGGSLTDCEIERLGLAFMKIDSRIEELVKLFDLDREDLNLDLGPLGNLM